MQASLSACIAESTGFFRKLGNADTSKEGDSAVQQGTRKRRLSKKQIRSHELFVNLLAKTCARGNSDSHNCPRARGQIDERREGVLLSLYMDASKRIYLRTQ